MKPYKIALIGTGSIASAHVEALGYLKARATLTAAVDINEEAVHTFSNTHNIPNCYTDVGEMLAAEKPDLVHICTPPQSHKDLSIQCMEAGAWVLCEKPLVISLQEIEMIAKAETQTGNYTSSVYQWRFGTGGQHLKNLVDSGDLGRSLLGVCQTTWYRDDAYYAVPWRGTWESESGGCSMIHGIHAMDMLLWVFGPWSEVTGQIDTMNHDIEVEDVSLALVKFENGARATIINSVVSPRQESYVRLDFEEATVELKHLYAYDNKDWNYSIFDGSEKLDKLKQWQHLPEDVPSLHTGQVSHLLDCLDNKTQPDTSGYGAKMTLEFIASMYKSALTGKTVKRGSIVAGDAFYESMNGGLSINTKT